LALETTRRNAPARRETVGQGTGIVVFVAPKHCDTEQDYMNLTKKM
jgi:hypothetical protein